MKPSHVLVPLDGSPLADDALDYALAVHGCRITVLNVVTPIDAGMSEATVLETDGERAEEARRRAEQLLKEAKEAAEEGTEAETEVAVESGEPAKTILEHVGETDVDHIVMGSHGGEADVTSRLLGTVSTKVVTESPVSVTVIR
jgi:nucleotide-binding universal stress UspA family protein